MVPSDRDIEGISSSCTKFKLSSIKESSGITTKVTPWSVTAATWNVKLLPPPVGIRARTSLPDLVAFMISL